MKKKLEVLAIIDNGVELKYQSSGASGLDLITTEEVILKPQETTLINTGVKLEIPEGFEGQVRSRSGFSTRNNVIITNGVGTIDSDYRGEIKVPLFNLNKRPLHLKAGDRIAQLIIAPVAKIELLKVSSFKKMTKRGEGGFGSTDKDEENSKQ